MNKNHDYNIENIVLAFDSSGCSHITIEHIVNIASYLKSTIQAIYIEDNNLLNAADLPFTREITLHTAQTRKLDTQQISRHFQNLANQIRALLEAQTRIANIHSTFRVTRGPKIQTILQESINAQLVFMPAVSRIIQGNKQKFVAVSIDNSNDMLPLGLSVFLARKLDLGVLVFSSNAIQLPNDMRELFNRDYPGIRFHQIETNDLTALMKQLKHYAVELLIIPETHSLLVHPDKIQRIINSLQCDIMVTRGQQLKQKPADH